MDLSNAALDGEPKYEKAENKIFERANASKYQGEYAYCIHNIKKDSKTIAVKIGQAFYATKMPGQNFN